MEPRGLTTGSSFLPFKSSLIASTAPRDILYSHLLWFAGFPNKTFYWLHNRTLAHWILLNVTQPDLDLLIDISHSQNHRLSQNLYTWWCVCLTFPHSCNKCLLQICYVPGNELGARQRSQKKPLLLPLLQANAHINT